MKLRIFTARSFISLIAYVSVAFACRYELNPWINMLLGLAVILIHAKITFDEGIAAGCRMFTRIMIESLERIIEKRRGVDCDHLREACEMLRRVIPDHEKT